MTKNRRQTLIAALTVLSLSITSPALMAGTAWAQTQQEKEAATLINQLKTADEFTRDNTVEALAELGEPAIPTLIKALESDSLVVRQGTVEALQKIGEPAIPALIKTLESKNPRVRFNIISVFMEISVKNEEITQALIKSSKDSDIRVQNLVKSSFNPVFEECEDGWCKLSLPSEVSLSDLTKGLKDQDPSVRRNAIERIRLYNQVINFLPELRQALKDKNADVRSTTALALSTVKTKAKQALPELQEALTDPNSTLKRNAALALGNLGREGKTAIPNLSKALLDKDGWVSNSSNSAIKSIALELQENVNTLSPKELDKVIKDLETALQILEKNKNKVDFSTADIATIRLSLNALKAKRNANLTYLIRQYPWATGILFYLLFFPSLWFLIFWLHPRWLLHISSTLKPYEFKLPETWGGAPVRIRDLTFLSLFIYQPRVLDAWVAKQITTVREEFPKLETVKRRTTYVPVAVELDDQKIPQLTPTNLQEIFQKKRICLLIWGEGGIGKTSIACQMAQWAMEADKTKSLCKHPMIPILIEEELDNQIVSSKDAFLEAIRGQLKTLTHHPTPIDESLLKHLLQQRRLLVMVDHFSELSEATQKQIDPDAAEFPVNALVVTSRLENSLGKINKTNLHPLRIEGAELSDFMQKYLDKLGKLDLFSPPKFHYICGDLAKLLEEIKVQGRSTTVLFAKLYADVLIAKLEGNQDGMLPETIPDLMLSYLNELNRDVTGNKLTDRTIHQDSQIIAWECLKATYRPTPAKITEITATLAALNPQDIDLRLTYLEEKLRLIQTVGSAKDKIKFSLDPVAEYLAGLFLVEQYGKDDQKWQTFLQNADSQAGSPDAIKGFLLAVRDCYLAKLESAKSTDFLPEEIAKRCIPATTTPPQKVPVASP